MNKTHLRNAESFVPPLAVAKEAARGLVLREKFRRGGTAVGMDRARVLSRRDALTPHEIRHIYAYFARHEIDKKGKNFYNTARPSNGYIAWLLWGGDIGKEWVTKVRADLLKEY
jgi:hypothetical protein